MMRVKQAQDILQMLIDGVDPATGDDLPDDHACRNAAVCCALQIAIASLDGKRYPLINRL